MFSTLLSRRSFLEATPGALIAAATSNLTLGGSDKVTSRAAERTADLVIIGGGLGGCAAALAAAKNGLRVIITEETDWIGGQLTSQAVPPDENPWIETTGGTRSYQELRTRIRAFYQRNTPLTEAVKNNPSLNPGNGGVSRLCHEPRIALFVLTEMLAPYVASGQVTVLLETIAFTAEMERDRVKTVTIQGVRTGSTQVLIAPWFVDATETGELLPLTGTEYVTGAESQTETLEPHAKSEAEPHNMQAMTACFAVDYLAGENFTIEQPREWSFWKDYIPKLNPAWPGRLLDLVYSNPVTLKPHNYGFNPAAGTGLFHYRRLIDRRNFRPGAYLGDISLVNWPQNDYLLGNPFECSKLEAANHIQRAKQLSLSLLYWLQTECPRPDGGSGWPGLRLRRDVTGTDDGLAKTPYIRESRRICALRTICEQDVGVTARAQLLGVNPKSVEATKFSDSVGIGSYRIDLHPSTGGDNYIDIESVPFQIPLGALIPKRVVNLLPACKNIGTTHITNGCYRLHPVEWNIGETVGYLAAYCHTKKRTPHEVAGSPSIVEDFQDRLMKAGIPLAWRMG